MEQIFKGSRVHHLEVRRRWVIVSRDQLHFTVEEQSHCGTSFLIFRLRDFAILLDS
jgi:hypothetical protein